MMPKNPLRFLLWVAPILVLTSLHPNAFPEKAGLGANPEDDFLRASYVCAELHPVEHSDRTPEEDVEETMRQHEKNHLFQFSSQTPKSKQEYCSFSAVQFMKRLCVQKGSLGLDNDGGLFGIPTGVCWWNSQFLRKVTYLTYFEPSDSSSISNRQFKAILRRIQQDQVVRIPGYETFLDLLQDPLHPERKVILQQFLNRRMAESVLELEWIRGIRGSSVPLKGEGEGRSQEQLEKQLREVRKIEAHFSENPLRDLTILYTVAQEPGPTAHAFLIYDLVRTRIRQEEFIKISVQDSSWQGRDAPKQIYYFHEPTGRWYNPWYAQKLAGILDRNEKPRIGTGGDRWLSRSILNLADEPRGVLSEPWMLWIHHENQMNKIKQSFREFCGHPM